MSCAAVLTGLAYAALALAAPNAHADPITPPGFPLHHLRLIIPYPPGGGFDGLFRPLAERMGQALGQPIVVDNVAGGNGMIGTEQLLHVPADGYTLLAGGDNIASSPYVVKGIRWDPLRDFAPVAHVAGTPRGIAVNPALPANDIRELIALSHTRSLNYATASVGSGPYMIVESLAFDVGLQVTHIPYKGNSQAITGAIAGQIDMIASSLPPLIGQIRAGRLRGIGVFGNQRSTLMPELPTLAESGIATEGNQWYALFVRPGTAGAVIDRLNAATVQALADPAVATRLVRSGYEIMPSTPAQLQDILTRSHAYWGKVAKTAGIVPE